jgi:hypothetical protein
MLVRHKKPIWILPIQVRKAISLNRTYLGILLPNDASIIVETVEVVIFPLGTAVLTFNIDWMSDRTVLGQKCSYPPSIEDIRTWLFLSKFRHNVSHVFSGWVLNDQQ